MNYEVKCHCGKVKLNIESDLNIIKQCNCSICKRKNGTIALFNNI